MSLDRIRALHRLNAEVDLHKADPLRQHVVNHHVAALVDAGHDHDAFDAAHAALTGDSRVRKHEASVIHQAYASYLGHKAKKQSSKRAVHDAIRDHHHRAAGAHPGSEDDTIMMPTVLRPAAPEPPSAFTRGRRAVGRGLERAGHAVGRVSATVGAAASAGITEGFERADKAFTTRGIRNRLSAPKRAYEAGGLIMGATAVYGAGVLGHAAGRAAAAVGRHLQKAIVDEIRLLHRLNAASFEGAG